jgi:rubrerythrin
MPSLRGTVTEQNLENAFAWESQANPRYLYLAQKADAEGFNDVAAVFRSTSESKTGHAHRHLEYLEEVRDPSTGKHAPPPEGRDSPARPTNTSTYIRARLTPPARKASTRSPTVQTLTRLGSRMPAASKCARRI